MGDAIAGIILTIVAVMIIMNWDKIGPTPTDQFYQEMRERHDFYNKHPGAACIDRPSLCKNNR